MVCENVLQTNTKFPPQKKKKKKTNKHKISYQSLLNNDYLGQLEKQLDNLLRLLYSHKLQI